MVECRVSCKNSRQLFPLMLLPKRLGLTILMPAMQHHTFILFRTKWCRSCILFGFSSAQKWLFFLLISPSKEHLHSSVNKISFWVLDFSWSYQTQFTQKLHPTKMCFTHAMCCGHFWRYPMKQVNVICTKFWVPYVKFHKLLI